MTSKILPIYSRFFSGDEKAQEDFPTKYEDLGKSLRSLPVDFSIRDENRTGTALALFLHRAIFSYFFYSCAGSILPRFLQTGITQLVSNPLAKLSQSVLPETARRYGIIALKTLIGGWALRHVVQRLIMSVIYPAQSRIAKMNEPWLFAGSLNHYLPVYVGWLKNEDFIVRAVSLEKNGVRYSGLLAGHKDTIKNGQWMLHATGNLEPIEESFRNRAMAHNAFGFNTLMINGPGVGKSEGHAIPESIGDVQELGLRFIEEVLKANKVVISGQSLGGAAVGQAILKHEFKKGVQYLVVRQMTFSRVSDIAAKHIGRIFPRLEGAVAKIIHWVGLEMDSIETSKKLQKLGIKEVVVQSSWNEVNTGNTPTVSDFQDDPKGKEGDLVIPAKASLARTLIHEKVTENKEFVCWHNAGHSSSLYEQAQKIISSHTWTSWNSN